MLKLSPTEQDVQALLLWCEICPDRRVSLMQIITPESPGMRSSLPRFYLPVACGRFQGLYIEMPATVQALSKEQATWLRVLSEQGHKVNFCANSAQAIDAILNYLKIERRR